MQVEKLSFVGTSQEFQEVAHLFDKRNNATNKKGGSIEDNESLANSSNLNTENISLILTRMPPVPLGQKQLYKALYGAGDKGLTAKELTKRMHREGHLAGILGALGTRVNYTKGIQGKPGVTLLIDIHRLDSGELHYRMKSELRQVLEGLNPDWLT